MTTARRAARCGWSLARAVRRPPRRRGRSGGSAAGWCRRASARARRARSRRTTSPAARGRSRAGPAGRSNRRRIDIPCRWARGPRSCVAGGGSPRIRAPPCRCGRSRRTPRRRLLRAHGSTRRAAPCGCTPARPPEGSRPFARPTHHGCYRRTSKAPRLRSVVSSPLPLAHQPGYRSARERGCALWDGVSSRSARVSVDQTTTSRLTSLADELAQAQSGTGFVYSCLARLVEALDLDQAIAVVDRDGLTQVFNRDARPLSVGWERHIALEPHARDPHRARPARALGPARRGPPPLRRRTAPRAAAEAMISSRCSVTSEGSSPWATRRTPRRRRCRCSSMPAARRPASARSSARWLATATNGPLVLEVIVHEPARLRAV